MSKNYKKELVGVLGHPVAENPTVVMLEAAFAALGLDWQYLTIEVLPQDLGDAIKGVRAMQMQGINLTIPHKVAVLSLLDEIFPDALLMGAVNTVRREGDRLIGENTDGKGFLRALQQDANLDPKGKRIVILGAGGAARAMAVELALAGATEITLVNRTVSRGQDLVTLLNDKTETNALFVPWEGTYTIPASTDVLVNATSIGLFPDIHARPDIEYSSILSSMIVCDVIPNPPHTPFLREAECRGATTLDGLGMLVYQGAIGFTLWTGHEAPVEVMFSALKAAFA